MEGTLGKLGPQENSVPIILMTQKWKDSMESYDGLKSVEWKKDRLFRDERKFGQELS
jgi:hypothetical protein